MAFTIGSETSSASRTFNAANQLLVCLDSEAGTTSFTYDNNGNLVQILPPGVNPGEAGEQVYTFNQRNLLTGTQLGAGSSVYDTMAEYVYDGDGHRLQQVDHSGSQPITTTYTNDNSGLSQVLVSDDGTTQTTNLLGLSLIQQDDGSQTRTLLADGLGSVRVEMVGGAIDSATTYEPYGKLLARSGDSGTVYGYTGEQHDAATGLVYLRARYYNPNLKLFMSRDPFPGWQTVPASQHGYSYVHNNPVNLTDPSGEFVPLILGGLIIGAVTGVTWDVMVNQGKGGLDNLHNILNPHYYCDVNWGQAAFTGAGGGLIGVVAAPAIGMASAAATGAYNAVPGAYAHWLHYSAYKYPWLGKFATTTTTAVGLADTVSDNILRVRALLGDPYAQSAMAEAMVTWNPGLAFRGLSDNDRVDYFRRQLTNPGDYVEAPSGSMSFNVLAGLARENVEFGLYRLRDGRRILVRGTEGTVLPPPGLSIKRDIAHTHYGIPQPSGRDIEAIWIVDQLPQTHSYIVTETGAQIKFSPQDMDPELFNFLLKKHRGVD